MRCVAPRRVAVSRDDISHNCPKAERVDRSLLVRLLVVVFVAMLVVVA